MTEFAQRTESVQGSATMRPLNASAWFDGANQTKTTLQAEATAQSPEPQQKPPAPNSFNEIMKRRGNPVVISPVPYNETYHDTNYSFSSPVRI